MTELTGAQRQLFKRVAERLQQHEFKGWFYGDSVGFEGLIAAGDLLGLSTWQDFSQGFFRAWATRMEPYQLDDNTAPGHAMCEIVKRTDDQVLFAAVKKLAEHLYARRRVHGVSITFEDTLRALRQPYGGVPLDAAQQELMKDPGAGIWLDCMHFDPPFYAHLAAIDGGEEWSQRAVDEILGYCQLLFDPELGTYNHYWLEKTGKSYIRGWGRGQGWGLLGLIDVVEHADKSSRGHDAVVQKTQGLAEAMRGWQLEDGNWWAMVHEPESGPESSTAAFMATAFYRGIRLGILPADRFREAADRAYDAMYRNLDAQGNLQGVSAAVYAALVQGHYWHVPRGYIVPWGQGPVLTALAARHRLDQ
ncbi:MAG TPA: glycoside hydrolase family 88 protein [Devosia sp.]|nr:glycoside hydrolase family 88 protein [Devosia sp.]